MTTMIPIQIYVNEFPSGRVSNIWNRVNIRNSRAYWAIAGGMTSEQIIQQPPEIAPTQSGWNPSSYVSLDGNIEGMDADLYEVQITLTVDPNLDLGLKFGGLSFAVASGMSFPDPSNSQKIIINEAEVNYEYTIFVDQDDNTPFFQIDPRLWNY